MRIPNDIDERKMLMPGLPFKALKPLIGLALALIIILMICVNIFGVKFSPNLLLLILGPVFLLGYMLFEEEKKTPTYKHYMLKIKYALEGDVHIDWPIQRKDTSIVQHKGREDVQHSDFED